MALLKYTTSIDAAKTVGEIQTILARAGARAVMTEYDDEGVLVSVSFRIAQLVGHMNYRMPCDVEKVLLVLQKQKVPAKLATREQASRVGWRIIKSWIEAQLAFIETEMVTVDQLFLPFAQTSTGETVYERYSTNGGELQQLLK